MEISMEQYLLCPDMEVSPSITLTENSSCYETVWEDGGAIDQTNYDLSRLEFICETLPAGKFPDFAISDMGCPVVSARLKQLLEINGVDNIEYFPASVIEKKGQQPKEGYYAANIIGLVDCIDKEKSEFRGYEENGELKGIFSIRKLTLLENVVAPAYVFWAHLYWSTIIIQEPFKKIFEDAGITGLKLILPENWDGYYG
jgi:hypothetical protein